MSLTGIKSLIDRNIVLAIVILSLFSPIVYFAPLLTLALLVSDFSSKEKFLAALVLLSLYTASCAFLLTVMKFRALFPFFRNMGVTRVKYYNCTWISIVLLSSPLAVLWLMPLLQADKVDWRAVNWPLYTLTLLFCTAVQYFLPRMAAHVRIKGIRISQTFGLPLVGINRLLCHLVLFACIPYVSFLEFSPIGTYVSMFALWFISALFGVRWIQTQDDWLLRYADFFTVYMTKFAIDSIWLGWFSVIAGSHVLLSLLFIANYSDVSSLIYVSDFALWFIGYFLRRNQYIDLIVGSFVFAASQAFIFVKGYDLL